MIDFLFDLLHVVALAGEEIEDSRKRAFVPDVHVVLAGIEHKFLAGLVDGVIGEMYEVVFQVLLPRLLVVLGRKTGQPFFVDVYSERIAAVDEHVDAHVEL